MAESSVTRYLGTEMEHRSRQLGHFPEVESDLPNIKSAEGSDNRPSKATNLLSYLGRYNPWPQDITDKDEVWLLDNTAYRSEFTGLWQAEFVAAVFDQNTGIKISKVVADVAEKVGVGKGDAAEATVQERLMPFVRSTLPGRRVGINFDQNQEIGLGPGGRNAISSDTRELPEHAGGDIVPSVAQVPEGATGILTMQTVYAEPHGWGVISGMRPDVLLILTGLILLQTSMIQSRSLTPAAPLASCVRHLYLNLHPLRECLSYMLTSGNSFLLQHHFSTYPHRRITYTPFCVISGTSSTLLAP
jgi:hypothetical protein